MERQELEAERERLALLLARREGRLGFSENVKAIKAALAEVDAELAKEA